MGKRDPRTMSVSNVDEVLRSAEEFVRKNSKEPSRTMNSEECLEGKPEGHSDLSKNKKVL